MNHPGIHLGCGEDARGILTPRYRAFETSGKRADQTELLQLWEDWDIHILERLSIQMSKNVVRSKVIPGCYQDLELYPEAIDSVNQ